MNHITAQLCRRSPFLIHNKDNLTEDIMELKSVTFTSTHDENSVVYALNADPHNPCVYDFYMLDMVTVMDHLAPYLTLLNDLMTNVIPGTVPIFDVRYQFISGPNWRVFSLLDEDCYPAAIEDDSSGGSDLHEPLHEYFEKIDPVPRKQEEAEEGYFGRATPVPLEMRSQPKSAPDLLYIAFNIQIGLDKRVMYQYVDRHQGMDTTPAYIMDMEGKTWDYRNLASCLEENPSLLSLLVERGIPFLSGFVKSVKEKLCPRSETSSVESMEWLNHPEGDRVEDEEEPVALSLPTQPKTAAGKGGSVHGGDSGFTSAGNSHSLDQRVAREEERLENEAAVAHIISEAENMEWGS
ncbi:uncharacterized protein [Apostichopus japonicus]|uniref:uncharacterized protein isoform X1 n=1 Tax=Stichopus japonicus TaxID=307972 RepID=UPI003AB3B151